MKKFIISSLLLISTAASAQKQIYGLPTNANNPTDAYAMGKVADKIKRLNINVNSITLQFNDYFVPQQPVYQAMAGDVTMIYKPIARKGGKAGPDEAFAMWGAIKQYYWELATKNKTFIIGYPISDEFKTPNKAGAGQHFENGSMYWSNATGAHEVHGAIKDKWKTLGWENSFLGFPKTDETATPDKKGRFNFFEGGAIYFHPNIGTYAIDNSKIKVWEKEGWEKGKLGYPVSDAVIKNNNEMQQFEFGAIVSCKASAYKVLFNSQRSKDGVYTKWIKTGGFDSYLGDIINGNKNYPKNHKYHFAEFQNGYIYESGSSAVVIKKGPIFEYFAKQGFENGHLGYPIQDEFTKSDGIIVQSFEHGTVFWSKSLGAFERDLK